MKHKQFAAAALVALALAACTKADDTGNVAIDNVAATPNVIATVPSSESIDTGNSETAAAENTATMAGNEAAPATPPTSIPAQFQGRWGINRADCTSTKGDAKGLLAIDGSRLAFYESKGTLNKVLGVTATSFDARYGFAGEGQTWARNERLKLVDGRLQRRTDAEPGQEPPVNLTYGRC